MIHFICYRMFWIFLLKSFFLAGTGLLLVVQKITSQQEPLYSQISCGNKVVSYIEGMGCSELKKKTIVPISIHDDSCFQLFNLEL